MSEVSTCRERLLKYCQGEGLDIGFGGDAITVQAITIDQRKEVLPQLHGNAESLVWFKSNVFDYVFSSHCLEDFSDTKEALTEWLRVIKPNGFLVLFLPDQAAYLAECIKHGTLPNRAHKHANFNLAFVKQFLDLTQVKIEHELWPVPNNAYSFDLVVRKLW